MIIFLNKKSYINKFFNWKITVFFLCLCKLYISYYTPITLISSAPHDDTLFFDLGRSLSNFDWLGKYNQLTLVKGPVFPLFLSLAFFFEIPLRIFEATLIISASLYFIYMVKRYLKFHPWLLVVIFSFLIFNPFQYFLEDFRVKREMIYNWLLLLVIIELIIISYKSILSKNIKFKNCILLGFFLFLILNTREEGIWLMPTLCLISLLLFFHFLIKKKIKIFIKVLFFIYVSFFVLENFLKFSNFVAYDYYGTNIFKDKDYLNGWSSINRIKQVDEFYTQAPNFDTWKKIFEISPSSKKIENWIFSSGYKNWAAMGCDAVESNFFINQNLKERVNCKGQMINVYLIFALLDAMHYSGLKSPQDKKKFMKSVSLEIDAYCNKNKEKCNSKKKNMLPRQVFEVKTFLNSIYKLPRAFKVALIGNTKHFGIPISGGEYQKMVMMSENYKLFFFPLKNSDNINFDTNNMVDKENLKYGNGYIDHIKYEMSGRLKFSGWYNSKLYNNLTIILNDKYACKVKATYIRADIFENVNSGFNCVIGHNLEIDEKINIYGILRNNNGERYLINILPSILDMLKNLYYNEECYLNNNPDVKFAVDNGKFKNGYEHFLKHGFKEDRLCKPIIYGKKIDNNLFYKDETLFSKIFRLNYELSQFYFYFSIFGLLSLFISTYISVKKNDTLFMLLSITLSSFLITRIFLITLLDTVIMAPIIPAYLSTVTYLIHVMSILSFCHILNYMIAKSEN